MIFVDSYRILAFVAAQLLITLSNCLLLRRLGGFPSTSFRPKVSVLIPARNEADVVGRCVGSLLAQDYPDYEVLVLDDGSEDRTRSVLSQFTDPRLRVLSGSTPPLGWTGKNWSCQRLAEAATGELFFFTDADTVHRPDTLRRSVDALVNTNADLLTALIDSQVPTLGEQITVPFLLWSIMAILPLGIAYLWRRSQAFVAASGKFMLFRRKAYEQVGGHRVVRDEAAEDMALARRIKAAGLNWRIVDASGWVSTRMYDGFVSALRGFSKNFFAIFDYRLLPAIFVWCWILLITWHPFIVLGLGLMRHGFDGKSWSALIAVLLAALIWVMVVIRFRLPWRVLFLYPLTMTVASGIGMVSIILTISGRTRWKGRRLPRRRVRLF